MLMHTWPRRELRSEDLPLPTAPQMPTSSPATHNRGDGRQRHGWSCFWGEVRGRKNRQGNEQQLNSQSLLMMTVQKKSKHRGWRKHGRQAGNVEQTNAAPFLTCRFTSRRTTKSSPTRRSDTTPLSFAFPLLAPLTGACPLFCLAAVFVGTAGQYSVACANSTARESLAASIAMCGQGDTRHDQRERLVRHINTRAGTQVDTYSRTQAQTHNRKKHTGTESPQAHAQGCESWTRASSTTRKFRRRLKPTCASARAFTP